jgi:cyclophilin family peptidyl-prolyl cis-trans isomerase
VVSGFVVQGGDPRGSGWGDGGISLRDEINPLSFDRGTVGMPKAGKDTGGCQLFITHVPTPHLDGRYTVFGKVVSGMDAVDRLEPGDRIRRAYLK